jgi:hypothetical protein
MILKCQEEFIDVERLFEESLDASPAAMIVREVRFGRFVEIVFAHGKNRNLFGAWRAQDPSATLGLPY